MNKIIIGVLALVLLGGGVYFYASNQGFLSGGEEEHTDDDSHSHDGEEMHDEMNDEGMEEHMDEMMDSEGSVQGDGVTVVYSDNGYSPSEVSVKVGESVTFLNQSSRATWPASANHPTHTVYPGSTIGKCGTDEALDIFDACGGVAPGESWEFTFNEAGTWGYHDHLRANYRGSVVVSE